MRDFTLRFDDRGGFEALAIEREPGLVEIDEIGAVAEGWLVNVRVMDSRRIGPVLAPFAVDPDTPVRCWA